MQLWEALCQENKDFLILTDENIDNSINSNHNRCHKVSHFMIY